MFRYVQESRSRGAAVQQLVEEFATTEIIVGRGGRSNLIISSREVSLEHAAFRFDQGVLSVNDLNSLTGVRINGQKTQGGILRSGTSVQIGDIEFRVEIGGENVSLIQLMREDSDARSAQADRKKVSDMLAALRIDHYLPSIRSLSYLALTLVVALYFLRPLLTRNLLSWSSGPISNNHKLVSADCLSCHALPFQHVKDSACESCHSMSEHTRGMAQLSAHHPEMTFRCAQCHLEHQGDAGVVSRDPRLCVGCHSNLKGFEDTPRVKNVSDFGSHPEFRITITDSSGTSTKVGLDEPEKAKDPTPIKLNHAVHLKPHLRGAHGPVTLECNSCHQLDADLRAFKPMSFEQHCSDCHTLGFDERLPDVQVPHAAPDQVYAALFTEYTKLLLLDTARGTAPLSQDRKMPGALPVSTLTDRDTTRIEKSARDAELQLFTKTACAECHQVTEKPLSESKRDGSRYNVTPVHIPGIWFSGARFSHGAHEPFTCESCHKDVRTSKLTSDLLLPNISSCRDCHLQEDRPGFVKSECSLCHSYHASESRPTSGKKDILEYLIWIVR